MATSIHDRFRGPLWDGHLLLLHADEAERRAALARWACRGLERGEAVVCAEDPAGPGSGSLRAALREHGVDADAAEREGRLRVVPPSVEAEAVRGAMAGGCRGVRLSVRPREPYAAACERSAEALCRAGLVTSALCQYDAALTTGTCLRDAAGAHVAGIRHRLLCTGGDHGGLVLAGEVDDSNHALLHETLRAAAADARPCLRLYLAQVTFVSTAGWRAVAGGTRRYRAHGGRLLLVAPQPGVERTARLIGVHRLTHVEVTATDPVGR
ncbi:hypothetical protein GCM10027168_61400 [Streptomyces capparidis]